MFDISSSNWIVGGIHADVMGEKQKKMLFVSDFDDLMINDELRWHVFKCFVKMLDNKSRSSGAMFRRQHSFLSQKSINV